ncbi:hypothetical protein J2752_000366 [Halarchaeum rubridurum]|uniref:Uncharacterized protein n=1 Tax=Halarchaeum rubridurum TaxID=489911 RepID=A0A830FNR0_9EURY|nr:hypothetical protein [Halarchaeum rubridurum]MBP1953485.1 hypothetical protein [Halarchaeum rubridurum]GGM64865.1 hypothetical protein GCM10009017_13730 [Halarchaeum rubridurum]
MPDDTADDDLAARVDALEAAVADLRAARAAARSHSSRRRARDAHRGTVVPRPPTPRDLLRFAVDDAIPATVAFLDAQKRALEALRAALRLVEPGRTAGESADAPSAPGRETLDRLDAALTDLRAAVSGDALPADAAARDLLEDARALTADLESEVDAAREAREGRDARATGEPGDEAERSRTGIPVTDGSERDGENEEEDERERRAERVEDELDQLRDEYDDGTDEGDSDETADDTDDEGDGV